MIAFALAAALAAGAARSDGPSPVPTLGLFPQDPAPEAPRWKGSVTVGGTLTTGNSETRAGNATADAELRRKKDRFTLGFLWVYGEEKNTTGDWNLTDRRTSGRGKYDYFLTEKTYLLAQASAEADEKSSLDLRTTLGVGAGRQFVETERLAFSGELGVAYVDEEYETTESDYFAGRAAYTGRWTVNKTFSLSQIGEVYPSIEDQDDITAKLDTRLAATFTESMVGQLQWILDYDNTPAPGADRLDHRLLLSVGWKF